MHPGFHAAFFLAACCAIPPAIASSQADIDDLTALIKKGGTEIVYTDCKDKSSAGKYTYSKEKKIDRLTICKDSFDTKDTDAYWEVLAHEATHIMQRCNGGTLLKDDYHPRVWRRLKAQAPHYVELLRSQYRDAHQMLEAEAFVMELQTPEMVKEWFVDYCLTPKKPAAPAPAAPAAAPAPSSPPSDPKPETTTTCPPASAGTPPAGETKSTQRWMF
jgi:hypothetical protein